MMPTQDTTIQLLQELSDAKSWPAQFKREIDSGADITDRVRDADEKIAQLEIRGKETMKRLGCVNPQTRAVYHGMADMLINWNTFKDNQLMTAS